MLIKREFDPPNPVAMDATGRPIDPKYVKKVMLEGLPDAVMVGNTLYLRGVTNTTPLATAKMQQPGFFARLFDTSFVQKIAGNPFSQAHAVSASHPVA